MTRKHYQMIAGRIRRNLETGGDALTLSCLAEDLAFEFGRDNPHFNRVPFLLMCGVAPR